MAWSWPGRQELRVVLLGNVGSGKSASGNTLLGTSHFACKVSACPITQQCEAETVNRARWRITMVDTPGLTAEIVTDTTKEKLLQCLQLSAPGPHVFLLVIPLGRFTQEEKDTVQRAAQLFNEHFYTFTIILFTFKDNLKNSSISDYISTAGESLQQLLQKCGNRYHAFNNNNPTEDHQAEQLLRKMNSLVEDNLTYYTLDDRMREERMERVREEKMERERIRRMERERLLERIRRMERVNISETPAYTCYSPVNISACYSPVNISETPAYTCYSPVNISERRRQEHLEAASISERLFATWLEPPPPVDLKEEFEKLKIHGLTEENLKKQADILEKWKKELESKEKRLNDREEQVKKQEKEMEEKKKLK